MVYYEVTIYSRYTHHYFTPSEMIGSERIWLRLAACVCCWPGVITDTGCGVRTLGSRLLLTLAHGARGRSRSQRGVSWPGSGPRPGGGGHQGLDQPAGRARLGSSSYEPEWLWRWLLGFKGGQRRREERGVPDPSHSRPLRSRLAWAHTAKRPPHYL